jgi:cytochrome c oxidase cbb3-type subunit III
MRSNATSRRRIGAASLVVALAASCTDWESRVGAPLPAGSGDPVARQVALEPGPLLHRSSVANPFEGDAQAIGEGKRLYHWYNCSGCHFNGGGGIGPPLMDDDWIYGGAPQNVLDSILQGRANGMPSYAGRLSPEDAWKIVAFVRTLGPPAPDPTLAERAGRHPHRDAGVVDPAAPEPPGPGGADG